MDGTLRGVFGRCLDAETIPPELETRTWPLLVPLQGGWVCSAWNWGWGGGKDAPVSQWGRKSRLIAEMRNEGSSEPLVENEGREGVPREGVSLWSHQPEGQGRQGIGARQKEVLAGGAGRAGPDGSPGACASCW